jgi:hypothetical protein
VRIASVLRLTPADADPWDIAIGEPGWSRGPVASWVAFISEGTGYICDVIGRRVVHEVPVTLRIAEDQLHDLLLFAADAGLTAVGPGGVEWANPGPWADLKVERIAPDAIVCSRYDTPHRAELRLDPATGSLL